jgi:hypothetical protein
MTRPAADKAGDDDLYDLDVPETCKPSARLPPTSLTQVRSDSETTSIQYRTCLRWPTQQIALALQTRGHTGPHEPAYPHPTQIHPPPSKGKRLH